MGLSLAERKLEWATSPRGVVASLEGWSPLAAGPPARVLQSCGRQPQVLSGIGGRYWCALGKMAAPNYRSSPILFSKKKEANLDKL